MLILFVSLNWLASAVQKVKHRYEHFRSPHLALCNYSVSSFVFISIRTIVTARQAGQWTASTRVNDPLIPCPLTPWGGGGGSFTVQYSPNLAFYYSLVFLSVILTPSSIPLFFSNADLIILLCMYKKNYIVPIWDQWYNAIWNLLPRGWILF